MVGVGSSSTLTLRRRGEGHQVQRNRGSLERCSRVLEGLCSIYAAIKLNLSGRLWDCHCGFRCALPPHDGGPVEEPLVLPRGPSHTASSGRRCGWWGLPQEHNDAIVNLARAFMLAVAFAHTEASTAEFEEIYVYITSLRIIAHCCASS